MTGIRDVVTELTKRGVVFLQLGMDWMKQDDLGIWESPEGKVAWFKDPDARAPFWATKMTSARTLTTAS